MGVNAGDEPAVAPTGIARYARFLVYPMLGFIMYNLMFRSYTEETRDALGDKADLVAPLTAAERGVEMKQRRDEYAALLRNVSTLMEERRGLYQDIADMRTDIASLKEGSGDVRRSDRAGRAGVRVDADPPQAAGQGQEDR